MDFIIKWTWRIKTKLWNEGSATEQNLNYLHILETSVPNINSTHLSWYLSVSCIFLISKNCCVHFIYVMRVNKPTFSLTSSRCCCSCLFISTQFTVSLCLLVILSYEGWSVHLWFLPFFHIHQVLTQDLWVEMK